MLVIRVIVNIKPEEKANFINIMQHDIAISQQFEGCQNFAVYEQINDSNRFILYEEWQNQQYFDSYKASEHFKKTGALLFPMMQGEPDTAYYTANPLA